MTDRNVSADLRVFSFGGGVQSTAVLCLAAQNKAQYDHFVFAHVGTDSENPDTLDYIERYAKPFCEAHGLSFVTVQKTVRGIKDPVTLVGELRRAKKSVIIPVRMAGSGALGNRNCTTDFKIRVIDKFIKSTKTERAIVGLGISLDEFDRARDTNWHDVESVTAKTPRKLGFWKRREYPLLDLRLNRASCLALITSMGLPVPPKSSCFFCPFHDKTTWIELKRKRPDLFAQAVEIEKVCNSKRVDIGRDGVFLHPSLRPLTEAVGDQLPLWPDENEENCADAGYCMV